MDYALFVLYVTDQTRSRDFYQAILEREPELDVPGMTTFRLNGGALLGLMPEDGIAHILGEAVQHPSSAAGVPRAELYLPVANVEAAYTALLAAGGKAVSAPAPRNWGDLAAYGADPDGHIVAFASPLGRE